MTKKGKEASNNIVKIDNTSIARYSSTLIQRGLTLIDSTITHERIRLLIVEDVPETRKNIRKLIKADENIWVVGEASNGREAIEMYDELKPDVVSMNICMPVMDGISATEIICRKHKDAKILMLSVQGDPAYMRRAMYAGAQDYITKPPMGDELISAINRLAARPIQK
jgi:pilus assembly protein CpaE